MGKRIVKNSSIGGYLASFAWLLGLPRWDRTRQIIGHGVHQGKALFHEHPNEEYKPPSPFSGGWSSWFNAASEGVEAKTSETRFYLMAQGGNGISKVG